MAERIAFIIKVQDEVDKFCGSNSIQYDSKTEEWNFVYTENVSNGFFTYTTGSQAQVELYKLKDLAISIGFKKEFYIERIDLNKVLIEEYAKNKDKHLTYPFIRELICVGKATIVA